MFMEFETFLQSLVPFEAEVEECNELVGVSGLGASFCIGASGGFADTGEGSPRVGSGEQAQEEVGAAIGIGEGGIPPAQAGWVSVVFAGPGDGELKGEDFIEGFRGDRSGHGVLKWGIREGVVVWGQRVPDVRGGGEEIFVGWGEAHGWLGFHPKPDQGVIHPWTRTS